MMGLTKSNFYQKPEYKIVTSWDDCGEFDLKIADLLSKYNLPGTFYVVIDYVGKEGYMTWDGVKELDRRGFEIGSHTISHPSDLKTLFDEQLHVEIQNSKDMLETALGHKVSSFCYPRGRTDERVKAKVKESGYSEARGTGKPGVIKADDRFYLPGTIHIFQRPEYGKQSILEFAKETIDRVKKEGGYCNIWGHSLEISRDNNWEVLKEVLKYASQK